MTSKSALPKLLRVQKHELEVRKTLVGRLQTRLNALEEEDAQWETSLHNEKKALNNEDPQSGIAYLRYATLVEKKRAQLRCLCVELERQLSQEQDLLKQEFAQVRALEQYLKMTQEKEDKSLEKKVQETLDERCAHKRVRR